MIYKDLTKQEDLLILCDCGHSAHQIILTTFDEKLPDDMFIYTNFFLVDQPFFGRLLAGLRYIFGYKCKFGHWDEVLIGPSTAIKLRDFVDKFLKSHQSIGTGNNEIQT